MTKTLLEIALILTDKDLVRINPTKTDIVPLIRKATNFELNMGDNSIEQTNETKHLGLMRNSDNKTKVDERIRVGGRTIYALLGPGSHARQGTCPTISYKIWKTYVIPRILYGVEVLNRTLNDIKKLETLQVQICKQIQGLPERTANLAAYSLLGVEPIEMVVDKLALIFLGNILQDKATIEFQIVERQHAMMKKNTQNYANVITSILRKYRLPELYNILQDIPTKANWKKEIKDKIQEYWEKQWIEEAKKRTSLKFLAIPKMGKTHYVWKMVPNDCIEVKRAEVKVRLLTGTYMLQSKKAKFSNNKETDICKLCYLETEDIEHSLIKCICLADTRNTYFRTLKCYLDRIKRYICNTIVSDVLLLQLILDPTMDSIISVIKLKYKNYMDIEQITRTFCYYIHMERSKKLS
jgi:hypothetical protein